MKRLTRLLPVLLMLVAALAMLAACDIEDSTQPSCYEIDVDHPSTSKKRTPAPKAPAYKAPSTKRR